jgi:hypothetical protein
MDAASYGFTVDLDNETLRFTHGYSVPITAMLDRFGEDTEDLKEVVFIEAFVPPDSWLMRINLNDLVEDDLILTTH